jgi:hypothetical protein
MSIGSNLSGHWTDEELVNSLYGVGPESNHLEGCADCQARLADMRANRTSLEIAEDISFDFLAAQRRAIYQRLEQPVRWWSSFSVELAKERAADAKLLQEVSAMAMDSGSASAEPLQGLFE